MYDLVVKAKKIFTLDDDNPIATWVAIKDKKFVATGTGEAPVADRVFECDGIVIPGIIDAHIHGAISSIFYSGVCLSQCTCIQDVLDLIGERCRTTNDELVVGWMLLVPMLTEARWPDRWELDKVSNGKKVIVVGYDMHGSVVNTKALESVSLPEGTFGVEVADRERTGRMVSDDAHFSTIGQLLSTYSDEEIGAYIDSIAELCLSHGITGVHALEGGFVENNKDLRIWKKKLNTLPIHVVLYPQIWDYDVAAEFELPRHGGCLTLDGSDMNYTMALSKPYKDVPTRGFLMRKDEDIYRLVSRAHAESKQCAFHALGDRAIDQILYIYDQVIKEQGDKGLRHRIEHFTMASDEQIEMAAKLGLVAVPQPEVYYLYDHPGCAAETQFGRERLDAMERYRIWTEKGLTVAGSSDIPVNGLNPLVGIHALVNAENPNRRLDITTALKYYTYNAAYAAHEEKERGTIKKGFFGDMTVLSGDPYETPGGIKDFEVLATICEGNVAYEK